MSLAQEPDSAGRAVWLSEMPDLRSSSTMVRVVWSTFQRQEALVGSLGLIFLKTAFATSRRRPASLPLLTTIQISRDEVLSEAVVSQLLSGDPGSCARMAEAVKRLGQVRLPSTLGRRIVAEPRADPGLGLFAGEPILDILEVWPCPADAHRHAVPVAWLFRGGQWAYWIINALGRLTLCRIGAASISTADGDERELICRLGRLFAFAFAPRLHGQRLQLRIGDVLDAVDWLPPKDKRNPEWAHRTLASFKFAMSAIREAGILSLLILPQVAEPSRCERWLAENVVIMVARGPAEAEL